jgi:hypothetical protein
MSLHSLQQTLAYSRDTIESIELDRIDFHGGSLAELLREFDRAKLLSLSADGTRFDKTLHAERDRCKLESLCIVINSRRTFHGLPPYRFLLFTMGPIDMEAFYIGVGLPEDYVKYIPKEEHHLKFRDILPQD